MSVRIFVNNEWVQLPLNKILLEGSIDVTINNISTSISLDDADHTLFCDATAGDVTVTLPASSGIGGRCYHIKKTDSSSNLVIVDGNASETIDGETTQVIAHRYDSVMVVSDGNNWNIT